MSEKAPEQTTIQWEVLFPLANVRHKNTHSCTRQSQWKGRHHRGRETKRSQRERRTEYERVCVCWSVERKCGMLGFPLSSGSSVAHRPNLSSFLEGINSSITCCNYALLLCCNNGNHIMCQEPLHNTYLELVRECTVVCSWGTFRMTWSINGI